MRPLIVHDSDISWHGLGLTALPREIAPQAPPLRTMDLVRPPGVSS